jgi:hypothetical protein
MAEDKIFADGFSFKRQENAPDFVVGRLSMKVEEAIAFMKQHAKAGWINVNIKTARSGNHYLELDTYEPKKDGFGKSNVGHTKAAPDRNEEVPF